MRLKLISDGTNAGTQLVDEATGKKVNGISKISFEASSDEILSKVVVELFNVPVFIKTTTEVKIVDMYGNYLENEVRDIVVQSKNIVENPIAVTSASVQIMDAHTQELIPVVSKIKWKATTKKISSKMKRARYK
jgi:hypothetical protein